MAQTNINIRMDEELKRDFERFCSDVGMTMTSAVCVFAKAVVRNHKIPFEISNEPTLEDSKRAFYSLREQAKQNGVQDMSLDEINDEIHKVRYGEE